MGHFIAALELDDVVIGGGQVKLLRQLPVGCRPGHNSHAFMVGFAFGSGVESAFLRRPRRRFVA